MPHSVAAEPSGSFGSRERVSAVSTSVEFCEAVASSDNGS